MSEATVHGTCRLGAIGGYRLLGALLAPTVGDGVLSTVVLGDANATNAATNVGTRITSCHPQSLASSPHSLSKLDAFRFARSRDPPASSSKANVSISRATRKDGDIPGPL